jgi:hypothetical protein
MYLGRGTPLFSAFVGFVAGYASAQVYALRPGERPAEELLPLWFREFVRHHFGVAAANDFRGWPELIREHTATEEEAFELLFTLIERCETEAASDTLSNQDTPP